MPNASSASRRGRATALLSSPAWEMNTSQTSPLSVAACGGRSARTCAKDDGARLTARAAGSGALRAAGKGGGSTVNVAFTRALGFMPIKSTVTYPVAAGLREADSADNQSDP